MSVSALMKLSGRDERGRQRRRQREVSVTTIRGPGSPDRHLAELSRPFHHGVSVTRRAVILLTSLIWVLISGPLAGQLRVSNPKSDEEVIFFPGLAVDENVQWTAHLHGWIFERGPDWGRLTAFKRLLRERFGLREIDFNSSAHFRDRARMFLVDDERGKRLTLSLMGSTVTLAKSADDGHIQDRITRREAKPQPGVATTFQVLTRPDDPRVFTGAFQLIARTGISVISDIDDTVKDSNVLNRFELAANTFLRDFRAVPGMSEVYRRWAGDDVVFHYVSGSPWQLYPALSEFLKREAFPVTTIELRPFRWKDRSVLEFLVEERAIEGKVRTIERLMRLFPDRRFVFVGDSGENDPEVYTRLASEFPGRVLAILIRDVNSESLTSPLFVRLYERLPAQIKRLVFRDVSELRDVTFR